MSITDELREFIDSLACHKDTRDMMRRIADRIDKEHAEAVADALQLRGEPDRWVELPVDADGVPIHVGDELTNGEDLPAKVRGMMLDEDGWAVSSASFGVGRRVDPSTLRHVQPDSWESIIKDAIAEGYERMDVFTPCEVGNDELVERCRRLAGDAE